jgi:xylulose-5-phosphate/fructose-6-phosphate phosphoketolase
MVVLNQLDRFHLALAAIARLPGLGEHGRALAADLERRLAEHKVYVCEHGEDMPEIRNWAWPYKTAAEAGD